MRKKQILWLNLAIAFFFAIIFYGNYIGINFFLFEAVVIPVMLYINRPARLNFLTLALLVSVFITALMVVLINTSWCIFINIILLFTLSAVLSFKGFRSFIHAFTEAFFRLFTSQFSIFKNWEEKQISKTSSNHRSNFGFRKVFYLIIVPFLILIGFMILYASASSVFYQKFEGVFTVLVDFFKNLNFIFILMVILGLVIGNVLFMKTSPIVTYDVDINSSYDLVRKRKKHYAPIKFTALKLQNLSGIVILILLNLLILYFNSLDIIHIWFGFEWDGGTLKEFVHEGTWVLVFSIALSALIALYFFKDNLNFYSKNKTLKILVIIWIIQNFIMTISVVLRNYWYINYFGFAYKRIAVLFFLLLTLVGLITIVIKIINKKSSFFLWTINGYSLLLVLIVSACINWDVQIAKFNFTNYERSLIDYRFMARLNNSALIYTLKPIEEMEKIDAVQEKVIPESIREDGYLWNIYQYETEIILKRDRFQKRYLHTDFLEWNLADYKTYKKLKESGMLDYSYYRE